MLPDPSGQTNMPENISFSQITRVSGILRSSFPVYSSGSIMDVEHEEGWVKPDGWTGPEPILYWNLDTLEGLVLMEGTQQRDFDALTEGKVSSLEQEELQEHIS